MEKENLQTWQLKDLDINTHEKKDNAFIHFLKKLKRFVFFWQTAPEWNQQKEFNNAIENDFLEIADEISKVRAVLNEHTNRILETQQDLKDLRAMDKELLKKAEANHAGIIELQQYANQISHRENFDTKRLENRITSLTNKTENEMSLLFYHNRRTKNQIEKLGLEIDLPTDRENFQVIEEQKDGIISDSELKKDELDFDYLHFEALYRGSEESIKEKQKGYLKYFQGKDNILDVGCGRGEFVKLLLESGKRQVKGIDLNKDMVRRAQEKNLPVEYGDVFDVLSSKEKLNLGGIFSAQVVEHLTPGQISRLIKSAYYHLKDGGIMILETINPLALITYTRSFPMDFTHVQQVHPFTLEFLAKSLGFLETELIYQNKSREYTNLEIDFLEKTKNNVSSYNEQMRILHQDIYGYQDYALIAKK